MSIRDRPLAFGFVGLCLAAWITISLRLGMIPWRRGGISKASDPFEFYAVIFGYSLTATPHDWCRNNPLVAFLPFASGGPARIG